MAEPAEHADKLILTINGGSSSIKFALFAGTPPQRRLSGQIERVGTPQARLVAGADVEPVQAATFADAAQSIAAWLNKRVGASAVIGVGHRIVNGGGVSEHQLITEDLLARLRRAQPLDLPHLPGQLALIHAFRAAFPTQPHVACFDTAFCRDLPRLAQLLPIPRRHQDAGVRRLGFHGLSYTYLMGRLAELGAAGGRVILAHLGSGASMTAVRDGKPVETSMGFTPTSGLVMGTRPGDLDPGLLVYLMREGKLSVDQADNLISQQCGLAGVSGTSSDMRDLLTRAPADPRAADAVALFCYQAKKFIGAFHAVLGGLDTLVFAGGIGEHCPPVRADICAELACLGIQIDPTRNAADGPVISPAAARVTVRVIPTDEEVVIARLVAAFAGRTGL